MHIYEHKPKAIKSMNQSILSLSLSLLYHTSSIPPCTIGVVSILLIVLLFVVISSFCGLSVNFPSFAVFSLHHSLSLATHTPTPFPFSSIVVIDSKSGITFVIDTFNILCQFWMNTIVIKGSFNSWISIEILVSNNLKSRRSTFSCNNCGACQEE